MYVKYLHQGLTLAIKGFQVKPSPGPTHMHHKQEVREGKQKQHLLQTQVEFFIGIGSTSFCDMGLWKYVSA